MKQVLVIAGPTASGKSAFAVQCARRFGGEIISGDSIQVYRGLNIGSGKVTAEEMQGIPHHLLDIRDPDEPYSVAQFQQDGRSLIEQIAFPIVAGGTGLYLKALLYDYSFSAEAQGEPADPELERYGNAELYEMLREKDPVQAGKIHPNNRRRLLRSLTILKRTGKPQSELEQEQSHTMIYDVFIAGCTMERSVLYQRISRRVEQMFAQGLEKEVRGLLEQGYTFQDPGLQGIGYKEWEGYFAGAISRTECRTLIQQHSRQYARRQYTWLNHQMPVHWFNPLQDEEREEMLREIETWHRNSNG